jgi:hypothetical protein
MSIYTYEQRIKQQQQYKAQGLDRSSMIWPLATNCGAADWPWLSDDFTTRGYADIQYEAQIHICSTQTTVVSVGTILGPDRLAHRATQSHCSDPTYTYMDWLGDNHIHGTLHAPS